MKRSIMTVKVQIAQIKVANEETRRCRPGDSELRTLLFRSSIHKLVRIDTINYSYKNQSMRPKDKSRSLSSGKISILGRHSSDISGNR